MAIDFPDSPTVDQQYSVGDRTWTWNGTYWQLSQTSSTFTASDTAPVNPSAGDIWFESDTGQTFVYYDQSWVEIGAATDLSDILSDADADTSIQVEASSDEDVIRFRTAGVERLHLTSGGHLIPQANVTYDLGSASNRFRDLYLSGSSIDLGGVEITSDGTSLALPPVSNIDGDFTVDTDTLHVDSTNNRVGIGTTSPLSQFQVDGGASGAQARITASGADASIAFLTADQQNWSIGIDESDAGKLKIGESVNVGTVTRVTIDSSGNVGINDTTPSYELDVNGDINATGDLRIGGTAIGEWTSFTPAFINVTIGNGTVDAKYCQVNKIVFWQVMFTLGSTSAILGNVRITYPIVASNMFLAGHGGQVFFEDSTGSNYMGNFERNSTVSVNLRVLNGSSTYVYHSAISATVPFTWKTGDRIVIQDFYEVP